MQGDHAIPRPYRGRTADRKANPLFDSPIQRNGRRDMVERFTSPPLELPGPDAAIERADLVFYDIDHSGHSFEARVFLDAPDADSSAGRDHAGYVGSGSSLVTVDASGTSATATCRSNATTSTFGHRTSSSRRSGS